MKAPIINKDVFHSRLLEITRNAELQMQALRNMSVKEKFQFLFNASSYDCNKIITAEFFAMLVPEFRDMLNEINLDSHKRSNILFPIGTCLDIKEEFGNHGHQPGDSVVVVRHTVPDDRQKIFMLGMDHEGFIGKGLYIYGLDLFKAYEPSETAVHDFIERLDPYTTHPSLLHAYRVICLDGGLK